MQMTTPDTSNATGSASAAGRIALGKPMSVRRQRAQNVSAKPYLTAIFKDGSVVSTDARTRSPNFAWCARGVTAGGKAWRLTGFSKDAESARKLMASDTRHIIRSGGEIEFSDVVPLPLATGSKAR